MSTKFEQLFIKNRQKLLGYIYQIVGNHDIAEDLVQESYIRVQKNLSRQEIQNHKAFLFQIGRNLAVDHKRHIKIREDVNHNDSYANAIHPPNADHLPPDHVATARESLSNLQQAIYDLPPRAQQVLYLHRIEGWSYDQIATHLNISRNTAFNDMKLAMAHCLNHFEKNHLS